MLKYIARRILLTIPILFAIVVVTFAFTHAMPGGPFDTTGNKSLPPHLRAQLEQQFNLDKPVFFNFPNDGSGPDTEWGATLVVKGYSDTGFTTETFPAIENAGIRLFGEYHLEASDSASCIGLDEEPGWAIISRREVCHVTGGNGEETFTEVRTRWQIDLLDSQFWLYLRNVARLDFGPSLNVAKIQENKQVTDDFKDRIPVSMQLGIFSTLVGFLLGIPLGVIAAVYHNTFVDFSATLVALVGQSVPAIVMAPLLITIFAVQLDWLPVADPSIWRRDNPMTWEYFSAVADDPTLLVEDPPWFSWDYFKALVLPVLTIGTGMSAGIARMTRASMLQVLNEDYIRTARSKGLRARSVLYVHALKNSLIPVATGVGGLIAGIVSGSFIIEQIFSIPGMGSTFIDAVNARDYTTIMGVTIFFSVILIFGNILVDVLYTWLDPRIRFD